MKKSASIACAVIALAAGGVLGYYVPRWLPASAPVPAQASAPAAPEAVSVRTAGVEQIPFVRGLTAVGSLRSDEAVVLRPEVAGRIREIGFKEGQPVKKGQLLVRLDDSIPRAEVQQAQANLSLSQSQYRRATELHSKGFISQQARDEAASGLKVQQAALVLAQARLDKTVMQAPFDGVIGLRYVSVGDYVSEGQDLAPLEAIDPLKVDFRIPELYLMRVRTGQSLQVRFDALPDQMREGRVYAISPLVDAGGRSILLRAEIGNQDGVLRPGLFARVQLQLSSADALVVPEAALAPSGDNQFVYRIVENRAQRVAVTIGERREGRVEVLTGLAVGDQVVVAGLQRITDGVPVQVMPANGS